MSASNVPRSFWDSYERISSKLKKRFMRKINFAEVSGEFEELTKSLMRDGNHQYAAFCALAVGRCEQVMQNLAAEANFVSEAGRMFWEAEQESQSYRFSVDGSNYGYEEYFLEAVDCYELAVDVRARGISPQPLTPRTAQLYLRLDNVVMAAQLQTELAHNLKSLRKYDEAAIHYGKAVQLHQLLSAGMIQPLYCLDCSLQCRLQMRDFRGALDVLVEITNLASSERSFKLPAAEARSGDYFRLKILEGELTRLLILLIERTEMRLLLQDLERVSGRPVSRSLSEATLTWGNLPLPGRATYIPPLPVEHGVRFDADTATLLESLVSASREGDARAVAYIENLLWPDMTDTQRDLFKLLLDTCQGSL